MPAIVVSMGEPAGIGPELILMAAQRRDRLPPFFVLADPALMRDRKACLGLDLDIIETDEAGVEAAFAYGLPVVPLAHPARAEPGRPSVDWAAAVIEAIERAATLVRANKARAMVTAPIMKDVLYRAGFPHPGHTEFLGVLAERLWGVPADPVMMIWSDTVAVVPVTVHVPIAEVPSLISRERIVATGLVVDRDLRQRFGLSSPRLVIAGLNPHAGENGSIGMEDEEIVAPAVRELVARGVDARGPLPADTLFHARARQTFDVALCMYHDQALAPAKALAFDEAVNVTLGLPFVRTSPDHGTALDLAGTGRANPSSFLASLALADRLSR
jgi:4-hydroxythreonine-4-phosphate dehydrogenase